MKVGFPFTPLILGNRLPAYIEANSDLLLTEVPFLPQSPESAGEDFEWPGHSNWIMNLCSLADNQKGPDAPKWRTLKKGRRVLN